MEVQNQTLFHRLNGTPAHTLIIVGLILLLAAPLIPQFKRAAVQRAESDYNTVDALLDIDLEDLRRSQERDRKADQEAAQKESATPIDYASMAYEEIQKQQAERQKADAARAERETERQKTLDEKREELKKKYDANERKRALVNAQLSASGMRWHHVLAFLGNLMLLAGLLVITLEGTGVTQKIALVVLLVAMFSALSGVTLNVATLGSLGQEKPNFDEVFRPPASQAPSWNP